MTGKWPMINSSGPLVGGTNPRNGGIIAFVYKGRVQDPKPG